MAGERQADLRDARRAAESLKRQSPAGEDERKNSLRGSDPSAMAEEEVAERLEVELHCPECGAELVVGIWDQSVACVYCGSLLVCDRLLGEQVFVVANAKAGALDVLALLIRSETESYRNELTGNARNQEGLNLEIPVLIDARVAVLRAKLEAELEPVDTVDFLVPYELHERTVVQAVLGRRGAAKESFVQSFRTEDLRRRYDASLLNLRDRGLKIRGSRLELLSGTHRESAGDRFLEAADTTPERVEPRADRARLRVNQEVQVIAQVEGVVRERHLQIWKHMSAARVRRAGTIEDYLVDRQFDTIAGKLTPEEAAGLRALPTRPLAEAIAKPSMRALASECPNCGADLALRPRAKIAFCANCALGIRVTPEVLEPYAYAVGELPAQSGADAVVGFPFWSLPFHLRAGGREFTRVWDWLEAVSAQPAAERFRENDPAESRLFVPARGILGARELDDAFAALSATATWRQPLVRSERAAPGGAARLLDVEIEAFEAVALARYALVALHDAQSTRSLNGLNFRKLVAEAELVPAEPKLVLLPLALHAGHWIPCPVDAAGDPAAAATGMRPVPLALLEDDGCIPRVSRAFSLT